MYCICVYIRICMYVYTNFKKGIIKYLRVSAVMVLIRTKNFGSFINFMHNAIKVLMIKKFF